MRHLICRPRHFIRLRARRARRALIQRYPRVADHLRPLLHVGGDEGVEFLGLAGRICQSTPVGGQSTLGWLAGLSSAGQYRRRADLTPLCTAGRPKP